MFLKIRVLTPDRIIFTTTAQEIILPTLTGSIGILPGHASLITALDTGLARIKVQNKWSPLICCGGLAEVENNQVTILSNNIEDVTNLTLSQATKDLEKATLALENAQTLKQRLDAVIEVKKTAARLEAVNYLSVRKS